MTRSRLFVLLQVDQDEDIVDDVNLQWLINHGYVADDGCELFITAKGDKLINNAIKTHRK